MKKLVKILALAVATLGLAACEIDNYEAPCAGVEGKIIDKVTGQNMELAQGGGNFSLRILETSWANGDETVVTGFQSLNMMQDGTFRNTKLFHGTYEMWPFETCCYEGEESKQTVELKDNKIATVNFEVTPYFEVEWVGDPWQDADGYVHATFKFSCNPVPEGRTAAVAEKAQLFLSTTMKVGTSSDSRYSNTELSVNNASEGNIVEAVSKVPVYFSQKLWLRCGVKAKVDAAHQVYDKYCMTSIKTLDVKGTK